MSTPKPDESTAEPRKEAFSELVRKFALASVGAVVLAQEEIEEFVAKLVQKGELAEKDGKTLVKDLLEKRKQRIEAPAQAAVAAAGTGASAITSAIDSTVDKVLHKINVPTKADVDELAKKIDDIDKKLEALAAHKRSA
jgi:poly(hydroxyalkanoate) granule-associated protein